MTHQPIDILAALRLLLHVSTLPDRLYELVEDAADEIESLRDECTYRGGEIMTLDAQAAALRRQVEVLMEAAPKDARVRARAAARQVRVRRAAAARSRKAPRGAR